MKRGQDSRLPIGVPFLDGLRQRHSLDVLARLSDVGQLAQGQGGYREPSLTFSDDKTLRGQFKKRFSQRAQPQPVAVFRARKNWQRTRGRGLDARLRLRLVGLQLGDAAR